MEYDFSDWLPLAFGVLMGLSILIYVVLDGFDLGVGILSLNVEPKERDIMVGSIGPFWDANETWLVMAVGLLLVAFPTAHGVILTALYLPATLMLLGLILRGVAFEFRAKAPVENKLAWDRAVFAGSLIATVAQGYMLGVYILGLDQSWVGVLFGLLVGLCLVAGYAFLGATWLLAKTEGALQLKALDWASKTKWAAAIGMLAISIASPLASDRIFERWFSFPEVVLLAPIPLITGGLFLGLILLLRDGPLRKAMLEDGRLAWTPFAITSAIFVLGFAGLAYSFFPYVVPEKLTLWDAASARDSLFIIFIGAMVTLPMIAGYSAYAYWVFRGKATELKYE